MSIPANLLYSKTHEWVSVEGTTALVGITAYAVQELGDVVHVDLPALGSTVTAGEPWGEIEATKTYADLTSPVDGEVTEINSELARDESLVNEEPYAAGWMFRVQLPLDDNGDAAIPPDLLSPAQYEEHIKSPS